MINIKKIVVYNIIISVLWFPYLSYAHHSTAGFFDRNKQMEIEGIITRVLWRNPHTVFELDVVNTDGEVTQWHVESGALTILRAQGLTSEIINSGDIVKILGDESLRGRPEMFARNILLSNGEEVMLTLGSKEYFSNQDSVALYEGTYDESVITSARDNADGIFRVWSAIGVGLTISEFIFSTDQVDSYPLTAEGKRVRAQWNGSSDFILGCTDWNMPRLMQNPLPMEFVSDGEDILIKFEEGDNLRTIHMNPDSTQLLAENTLLGYSVGHWEEQTLVVRTTNILESNYEMPVSNEIELVEWFTPNASGSQLHYEIEVTDPVMLTAPLRQERVWNWRPEIIVHNYACEVEQSI